LANELEAKDQASAASIQAIMKGRTARREINDVLQDKAAEEARMKAAREERLKAAEEARMKAAAEEAAAAKAEKVKADTIESSKVAIDAMPEGPAKDLLKKQMSLMESRSTSPPKSRSISPAKPRSPL